LYRETEAQEWKVQPAFTQGHLSFLRGPPACSLAASSTLASLLTYYSILQKDRLRLSNWSLLKATHILMTSRELALSITKHYVNWKHSVKIIIIISPCPICESPKQPKQPGCLKQFAPEDSTPFHLIVSFFLILWLSTILKAISSNTPVRKGRNK
jgi:hypothetical protein